MKLTRSDIEKKEAIIKVYEQELKQLREEGADYTDKEDVGFVYCPSQMMYLEKVNFYKGLIQKEKDDILHAEIIDENDLDSMAVVLGDTVTILMEFKDEEPLEHTVLLSDVDTRNLNAVTTSSPVGIAIYGKNVGDVVMCDTPKGIAKITILEKSRGIKR